MAELKVGVIGSRTVTDRERVWKDLDRARAVWGDFTVVSGGAKGPDNFAHQWAVMRGLPFVIHRPDYPQFGKRAPLVRNHFIVDGSDRLIAFWDGKSRGTQQTIRIAKEAGKSVYLRYWRPTDNTPQEESDANSG